MKSRLTCLENLVDPLREIIYATTAQEGFIFLEQIPIPAKLIQQLAQALEDLDTASSIPTQILDIAHRRRVVSVPILVSLLGMSQKDAGEAIQSLVNAGHLRPSRDNAVVFEPAKEPVKQ